MSISGFLISSGIALLAVLLAWGNQLREGQEETKRVERLSSRKVELQVSKLRGIVSEDRPTIKHNPELDFVNMIRTLSDVLKNKDSEKNLGIINRISKIETAFANLKKIYDKKYWLVIELTSIFFISGIFTFLVELFTFESTITLITYWSLSALPFVWIFRLLLLLKKVYFKEEKLRRMIKNLDSVLED